MMIKSFPAVLGMEASGTVEAIGTDVRHVRPGDAVMARCTVGGRAAAYQVGIVPPDNHHLNS